MQPSETVKLLATVVEGLLKCPLLASELVNTADVAGNDLLVAQQFRPGQRG